MYNTKSIKVINIFLIVVITSLMLISCVETPPKELNFGKSQKEEANVTELNQNKINKTMGVIEWVKSFNGYSQEVANLMRRFDFFNTPTRVTYICLLSFGNVIECSTVKGKVSTLDSTLSTPEQIVNSPFCGYGFDRPGDGAGYIFYDCSAHVLESPQLDGSYNTNGTGIFWFDANDHYHEWNGEYKLSSYPPQLTIKPLFINEPDTFKVSE